MEKKNQKAWWIILIVGAILLLLGGYFVNNSDNSERTKPKVIKVELGKQYKEELNVGDAISFRYKPEESGYYYFDWSHEGDEEAMVDYEFLKNNKEPIETEGMGSVFFVNLEKGNTYYFNTSTESNITVSYILKKFAEGTIKEGEEVAVSEDTVLFYKGDKKETKQLTLSDDTAGRVIVYHPEGYSIGYSFDLKGLFDVKPGLKYNLYCYDIKKETKVLVKKAPEGIIIE